MKGLRAGNTLDESLTLRFTFPVIAENTLTIFVGLVFSQIISTISGSTLAAIGMANVVMTTVFSLFSMVITGAAVLVSRQIGAGEGAQAADTIEQASFLAIVTTVLITVASVLLAQQTMRLLMPTAEDVLFGETVRYYRVLMLSLPCNVLYSVLSGVCRSMGDSRNPMLATVMMNLAQILFAWLFIRVMGLGEIGAGLAHVGCRIVGAGLMLWVLLRSHRFFVLKIRNFFRPRWQTCLRILRIGVPVTIESVFVQVGYLLGNSMAIALGTFECGVYQVLNTLNTFVSLPNGICSVVALAAVGHLLGAQRPVDAKKAGHLVWAAGIGAVLVLGVVCVLLGDPLSALYSADAATVSMSASLIWILVIMDVAGVSINSIDSQLRAGGDVRYVMTVTLVAVWGIRLPLTYLFCFVLDFGVPGIFWANTISLYFRAILGFIRHCGNKWIRKSV